MRAFARAMLSSNCANTGWVPISEVGWVTKPGDRSDRQPVPVRLGVEPELLSPVPVRLGVEPVPLPPVPVDLGVEPILLPLTPGHLGVEPDLLRPVPVRLGLEPDHLQPVPIRLGVEPVPLRRVPVRLGVADARRWVSPCCHGRVIGPWQIGVPSPRAIRAANHPLVHHRAPRRRLRQAWPQCTRRSSVVAWNPVTWTAPAPRGSR